MRNRLMIGTAALLLASATFVGAQDKPQEQAAAGTSGGEVSVGGRFTSSSGDKARYERYQDLRGGANVNVLFNKETSAWTFNLKAHQHRLSRPELRGELQQPPRQVHGAVRSDAAELHVRLAHAVQLHGGELRARSGLRAQVQASRGTRITNGAYAPTNVANIVGVPQTLAQLPERHALTRSRIDRHPVAAQHVRGEHGLCRDRQREPDARLRHVQEVGQPAVGRVVRVPERRRSAARHRQPDDGRDGGGGVGEPSGHDADGIRLLEVRPGDRLVHLRQPPAGNRLQRVQPGDRRVLRCRTATARRLAARRSAGWRWRPPTR